MRKRKGNIERWRERKKEKRAQVGEWYRGYERERKKK